MHIVGHATESEVHASGKFYSISDPLSPPPLSLSLSLSLSPCDQIQEKESLSLNSTIRTSKRKFAECGHQIQVSRAPTATMQWLIQKKKMQSFFLQRQAVFCEYRTTSTRSRLGNYMLSDATFVHSVWHFGCNQLQDTKTKQWQRVGQSGRSGFMSTALWQCLLTMSTCLSTIQALLPQTTNIWKIPAQTDVTCSGVLLQLCSRPSILLISSTTWCSFWLFSAPLLSESNQRKNRIENCSTAASQSGCVHLRSIERARYATKHLRDTDSDYVMKKPSRCWLGAVPRYWKVVASCFQNVGFAENTSAPLAPRARIFQPILSLCFLFSCSWICLQNGVSDFFYSISKFSGVQKKTELAKKRLFSDVFKYLTNFRFEIWNSETPFCAEGHQE